MLTFSLTRPMVRNAFAYAARGTSKIRQQQCQRRTTLHEVDNTPIGKSTRHLHITYVMYLYKFLQTFCGKL